MDFENEFMESRTISEGFVKRGGSSAEKNTELEKTIGNGQGYWSKGFRDEDRAWHDCEEVRKDVEKPFVMRDQELPS